MPSHTYRFEAFIERMKALDYREILVAAEAACGSAEAASYRVRGAVAARAAGSTDYARRIKAFLWFMRSGTLPGGSDRYEWSLYREVAECLVEKGQFKKDVLDALNAATKQR